MLRNKLLCLEYPNPSCSIDDQQQLAQLVLWLEDQKIRKYKIEERADLRKVNNSGWLEVFNKYKDDLSCPKELTSTEDQLKWIVAYAVKLEYSDNADDFRDMNAKRVKEIENSQSSAPSMKSVNPFDNLDFSCPEFQSGVSLLAVRLSIPHHHDPKVVLVAISRVIKENLNKEALKQSILDGKPFPIFEGHGMNQKDKDVEQAARILRLLQIQSLREIQTLVNETIVETQSLTSDGPKTDTKIGQVGSKSSFSR